MKVNITRALNVRQYTHWLDVDIPNEIARQVIDGDLSEDEVAELLEPYVDGEPDGVHIDSMNHADHDDRWFDVEPTKEDT